MPLNHPSVPMHGNQHKRTRDEAAVSKPFTGARGPDALCFAKHLLFQQLRRTGTKLAKIFTVDRTPSFLDRLVRTKVMAMDKRNAWRWVAPLLMAMSAGSAQAVVTGGIIVQTAERVDYAFSGDYTDIFSSVFSDGPWTITLASPVSAGEPGAGYDWSLRLMIQYAGLGGERTDYWWGVAPPAPNAGLYGYSIENVTGELDAATVETGSGVSLPSNVWQVDGMHRVAAPQQPVPEPATIATMGLALIGLLAARAVGLPGKARRAA